MLSIIKTLPRVNMLKSKLQMDIEVIDGAP